VYRATVIVTLRKAILDPQGKAVHHAVESLGMTSVQEVRIGKHVQMLIDVKEKAEAERITRDACTKLLANPVMEDYTFTVDEIR
jgi:phosphoribosylformylglycinamidine synthase PurS subunit